MCYITTIGAGLCYTAVFVGVRCLREICEDCRWRKKISSGACVLSSVPLGFRMQCRSASFVNSPWLSAVEVIVSFRLVRLVFCIHIKDVSVGTGSAVGYLRRYLALLCSAKHGSEILLQGLHR